MNLKELKEILQMLEERDIAEFELEEEGKKLRVRRASSAAPVAAVTAAPVLISTPAPSAAAPALAAASGPRPDPAPPSAPAPVAAPPPVEGAASGLAVVKSPIVGTFYRSPDPNGAPFVSVGDHVKVGQVLCIIEAMKLMNEIECEVAGEVVKVHHDNGQPVQYGEPLFTIRP